jgi:uncharacterized protein (TIGR03437 family)
MRLKILATLCALATFSPQLLPGLFADELKTGYFRGREVVYQVIDGMAVTEGDIVLGTAEELARSLPPEELDASKLTVTRQAIGIEGSQYRWPDRTIPYTIASDLSNQQRVLEAIAHWNENTPIKLVERTSERNYLTFRRISSGCSSNVGMVSIGQQFINLDDGCPTGSIIHEIGHTVGLYHEQSRQDREFSVQFLNENVDKRYASQFRRELNLGFDVRDYDFGSIMHYSASGFSRNGLPTLATLPAGIAIGQRAGLSPGDIEAVRRMYDDPVEGVTIGTFPTGIEYTVDGETFREPRSFRWAPGTRHTVSVNETQGSGNTRFRYARWSDGGARSHTITAPEDGGVLIANFITELRVVPTAIDAGSVRVEPASPDGYYAVGSVIRLTAEPADGANFLRWEGGIYTRLHGVSQPSVRVPVAQGLNYIARFTRQNVVTINSDPPAMRLVVDGQTVTAPAAFVWQAGSTHRINAQQQVQFNTAETARYRYDSWDDGGEADHEITVGNEFNRVITAKYNTQFLLTTQGGPGGTLQLSPPSPDGFYDAGAEVAITPVPSDGFGFSSWGDDGSESLRVEDQTYISATFARPGVLTAAGIVNGASFLRTPVVPGQIVTIFGLNLGPDQLTLARLRSDGRVDSFVDGTRVLFDGVPAPIVYLAKNQLSVIVPYAVAGRSVTRVQLERNGAVSNTLTLEVGTAAPAFFTANASGSGPGAFLNQNGTVNSPQNPAQRGQIVVLYATGGGQTVPAGQDGLIATGNALPRPVGTVRVWLAGREVPVHYAGGAPGLVAGAMQINVEIPADAPSGQVPILLQVGDRRGPNTATVSIR